MKSIKVTTTEATINNEDYIAIKLTGNTYEAKEIIKAHDLQYNNDGEPAWLTPYVKKSDFFAKGKGYEMTQKILRQLLVELKDNNFVITR